MLSFPGDILKRFYSENNYFSENALSVMIVN